MMGTMGPQVEMFKAARLFSPYQVCQLRPVANDVDVITSIAFLDDAALVVNLKNELPRYLTRADGIASSERVFSILTTSFGHLQDLALQDYIECSLMLQFNKR